MISFIQYIEDEVRIQKRSMRDLLNALGAENRLRLSEEVYCSFVQTDKHPLVRIMLEKAIQMEAIEDAQRAMQAL